MIIKKCTQGSTKRFWRLRGGNVGHPTDLQVVDGDDPVAGLVHLLEGLHHDLLPVLGHRRLEQSRRLKNRAQPRKCEMAPAFAALASSMLSYKLSLEAWSCKFSRWTLMEVPTCSVVIV